ncbi:hypothetical protein [Billgrantia antri]|uniref:Tail assembly chaperone n=1 Tax=Billgrantia antri TaxID=2846777 RepID=A0ABS6ZJI4_9GAMM|nr:hypothetical protein [Halomonas antri]MBW6390216.1 hypothetical protein [Halomonas antri]
MSDEEQRFGLDIPAHAQRRGRGLIAGAMENPPPKLMADHLELYDDDGASLDGKALMEQMLAEMQQMATPLNAKPTATSLGADFAIELAEDVLDQASADDFQPDSVGLKAILLAYIYGKLTMPRRHEHRELIKHAIADIRRQVGPSSVEAERERGRQWMRDRASEIWEQDHARELLIGEVAAKVQRLVNEEARERESMRDESVRKWPKSLEKIRKAIRPVAPDYATRPGRPSRK